MFTLYSGRELWIGLSVYLWRHVLEGAGEGLSAGTDAGQALARAEVWDLDDPAVRVHQHVVPLQAVNTTWLMHIYSLVQEAYSSLLNEEEMPKASTGIIQWMVLL